MRYWQPFDVHAVVRTLSEHRDCVFDFGAVHSVYDDPALLAKVEAALAPFRSVVLLLPAPDPGESVHVLHERGRAPAPGPGREELAMWRRVLERLVRHPSNHRLARHTVYTEGWTPEETRADILAVLGPGGG